MPDCIASPLTKNADRHCECQGGPAPLSSVLRGSRSVLLKGRTTDSRSGALYVQATRVMFWAFVKQCGAPQRRNLLLAMQCRCGTLCHGTVWVRWTLLDSHLGHQMSLPPQFIWVGWGVADFKAQIRAVGVGFTLFRHVQSIQEPQIRLRTPLEQCQYHELFQKSFFT